MSTTTSALASIQLSSSQAHTSLLQDNSRVFIRVLEKRFGNEYVVSLLGNKFTVVSQRPLIEGSAFRATVTIKEGKVFLSPDSLYHQNSIQKFSATGADSLVKLQGFLQNLGLPQDSLSLRMVQYFQSSGLTFNMKLASKARSIGLKFPGKEHEAAEVSLFLEQKGISSSVDTVLEVLSLLYADDQHEKGSKKKKSSENANETEDDTLEIDSRLHRGVVHDEDSNDIIERLFEDSVSVLQRQQGLLGFLNQLYVNPLHWIILPFELGSSVSGSMRLLLDFEKKTTEKVLIFAFVGGKKIDFMVEFKNAEMDANSTRYVVHVSCDSKLEQRHISSILNSCLPQGIDCEVQFTYLHANSALFSQGDSISVVEVEA